ncbi:MAG: CobW family GTP-binding protein [Halanaerobiaceae bacterium]
MQFQVKRQNNNILKKKIVFLTGFLGSGKTTLLNQLLKHLGDVPVGIIVNEFGKVNIDTGLIELKDGMKIEEINNGSIFCSCLSGSFVESILSFDEVPVEYLLVESTGLARPGSVSTILEEVEKISNKTFKYQGMFCTVDASRYLTLIQSIIALKEQIEYSDLIVINKTDLVNEVTLEKVEIDVREKNRDADIVKTTFGQVDKNVLEKDYSNDNYCSPHLCSSITGNETHLMEIDELIDEHKFITFLEKIAGDTYRIKGYVRFKSRPVRIDCVGDAVGIKKTGKQIKRSEVVIITAEGRDIERKIENNWEDCFPSYRLSSSP